jgi:peptide-methionine (R)-S-oxide reductase
MKKYNKNPEAISKLSPEQYRVTQQNATERPGTGEYMNNMEPGIYVDIVSGEPLFASSDKYESGCGWPSFTKPIEPANINELRDATHGMTPPKCARRTATAISGMSFPMARRAAVACAIASTRPHCGSSSAPIWWPRAARLT